MIEWNSVSPETLLLAQQLGIPFPDKIMPKVATNTYVPDETKNQVNMFSDRTKDSLKPRPDAPQNIVNTAINMAPLTTWITAISERDVTHEITALESVFNRNNLLGHPVRITSNSHSLNINSLNVYSPPTPSFSASLYIHIALIARAEEEVKRFSKELYKVPDGALVVIFAKISNSSIREMQEYKITNKLIYVIFFESGAIDPDSAGVRALVTKLKDIINTKKYFL